MFYTRTSLSLLLDFTEVLEVPKEDTQEPEQRRERNWLG